MSDVLSTDLRLEGAGSLPADLGYGTHPAPSEKDKRGAQIPCYCYVKRGDNKHCPKHGYLG
jgi:hypothetical protein